jgi:hypothetical protein
MAVLTSPDVLTLLITTSIFNFSRNDDTRRHKISDEAYIQAPAIDEMVSWEAPSMSSLLKTIERIHL